MHILVQLGALRSVEIRDYQKDSDTTCLQFVDDVM